MWIIIGGIACGIFFIVLVLYISHKVERRKFIKAELEDVISKCMEVEERCKEGYGVYFPEEDEKYLYEILVKDGIMIRNPMGEGYSFSSAENELWKGVPRDGFAKAVNYQDDDGVIQVFEDEDGKVIKTVTEDDLKEKDDGS